MLFRIWILLVVVPLLELAILVQIGHWVGTHWTIALVVATGFAGAWLARHEGTRTLRQIRTKLQSGEIPGREVVDGLLILLAGAVLITPGVLTDIVGLALLVPPVRRTARERLVRYFRDHSRVIHPQEEEVVDVQWREVNPAGIKDIDEEIGTS